MRPWAAVADWFESNAGLPLNMPALGLGLLLEPRFKQFSCKEGLLNGFVGINLCSVDMPSTFSSDKIAHLAIAHHMSPFFNRK